MNTTSKRDEPFIHLKSVKMAFDDFVVMRDLDFSINRGEIFFITGGSGCGKTTLLRHMLGLLEPAEGAILYDDFNFTEADTKERRDFMRKFGVTFQGGALWSSMTLAENIMLSLEEHTKLSKSERHDIARLKLALVGLRGFEDYYPHEISGGMKKRVGLARALAMDPEVLFFDEVSAGLDPISSKRLDDLILELRNALGATVVMVSHELPSIFTLADRIVYLDVETRTVGAIGDPKELKDNSSNERVKSFLNRELSKAG